jgi:plastocyanin
MEDTNPTPSTNSPKPKRIPKNLVTLIIAVLAAVLLLIGFKLLVKDPKPADIKSSTPAVVKVMITTKGFEPATLDVSANTVVEWTSNDSTTTHIVEADQYVKNENSSNVSDLISPQLGLNAKYRYTFTKPGNYSYHDKLKPTTTGTVIVK